MLIPVLYHSPVGIAISLFPKNFNIRIIIVDKTEKV